MLDSSGTLAEFFLYLFVYSPAREAMYSFHAGKKQLVPWKLLSVTNDRISFEDTQDPLHFDPDRRALALTGELNVKTQGGAVNTRGTYSGTCKLVHEAR